MARKVSLMAALCLSLAAGTIPIAAAAQQANQPAGKETPAASRNVGTIKAIAGNTITLTTDAGSEVTILVLDTTKIVQIAPGQRDLKDATPIQLAGVQPGDRLLVRGKLTDDGRSVLALSLVAMKKSDVADKQAHDREEWQKHGTGGLVNTVDVAHSTVTIMLPAVGEKRNVIVQLSKDTILRRYAPDSVKFDDARPAPIEQIKPGDQLRARGARNSDGTELSADEVVSGTFRNIAGTISMLDQSAGYITIQDLSTKKLVTIKITPDSQLRRLAAPMAQRIALRLKGGPADASPPGVTSSPADRVPAAQPAGPPTGGAGAGGPGGTSRSSGGGPSDLQQAIMRMPAATLADLQKGDAVMVVATPGGPDGISTAITLLSGVEPILEASPKSSASTILSPWSLSAAPGGEGPTP